MTAGVVLCAALLLALIWRESQHARHLAARERSWDLERGALLQRIQSPERAVAAQARREEVEPRPHVGVVPIEDDKAMLAALGQEVNHDGSA